MRGEGVSMEFIEPGTGIRLKVEESVLSFFDKYMEEYDFKIESGGIIVGTLNLYENQVIVTDVTLPHVKDIRKSNIFKRDSAGHQEEMDRLWNESKKTKTYLGEWHTHKQDIPVPSWIDKNDWKRISKKPLNYKAAFFVIVGQKEIRVWMALDGKIMEMKEVQQVEKYE